MMTITNAQLTITRLGRQIPLQRVTAFERFAALRTLGYLAAALVSGLVSVRGGKQQ